MVNSIGTGTGKSLADITNPGSQTTMGKKLTEQDFLKLMVEQMKNQNPLDGGSQGGGGGSTDFMGQIAQFDSLTALGEISKAIQALASISGISSASSLIGRTVKAAVPSTPDPKTGMPRPDETVTGKVSSVTFENGSAVLHVGTRNVPANLVQEIV